MDAGAKFGLLLLSEMILFFEIAPQPSGAVLFWSLQVIELTIYTAVVWHRTHLAISTVGGIAATLGSLLLAALQASGYSFRSLPIGWAVVVCCFIAVVPLSILAESRTHRSAWNEWKRHMAGMALKDILPLRHIPQL
jgi:hypothetical protein